MRHAKGVIVLTSLPRNKNPSPLFDVASSTPLASSPTAEWDLTAVLRNLNLARAWAAGAKWTDFSTDSAPPRAPGRRCHLPPRC